MQAPSAVLRLSLRCSNACVFCAQHGVSEAKAVDIRARLNELRNHFDAVTFVGGEPSLDQDLTEHVRAAKQMGFVRIGLQTNGHALKHLATGLAAAGLTEVQTTVLGARAEVHDYHTGTSGSFSALEAGVAACREAKLDVLATTVLCRSNFRVLDDIHPLLRRWGVLAWLLQTVHTAGRAVTTFDRVVPRLALALPYALHAMTTARAAGLPTWIRGAPLCMLGPYAERALLVREPGTFANACDNCAAKPACAGVNATYLQRFSEEELKAMDETPTITDDNKAWSRRFADTGEMAMPPADLAVHAPPRDARKHLPVLAKAAPGAQEVARGSDKRSGDELAEIFPDLLKTESQ